MKTKKQGLILKKESVANLNSQELNNVKGGTAGPGCTIYPECPPGPINIKTKNCM